MPHWQKIKYVIALPPTQLAWVSALLVASFIIWLLLKVMPVRQFNALMGHHFMNRTLCILATPEETQKALRMGNLMDAIGKHTPWPCTCLCKALCVKWLLNRYQIPAVFYMGVKKADDTITLKAHAWINVERHTVIGGPQHHAYRVAATYIPPNISTKASVL